MHRFEGKGLADIFRGRDLHHTLTIWVVNFGSGMVFFGRSALRSSKKHRKRNSFPQRQIKPRDKRRCEDAAIGDLGFRTIRKSPIHRFPSGTRRGNPGLLAGVWLQQ
jgi:hypothetical protein